LTDSKAELISAIKSKEAFSIDGTVTKDGKAYRINEYYDFSTASKFDVAAWAYKAELLTEAEKIDCYCDLIIERNFENIYCLNPIYAEIEEYKASNKLSSELDEKIRQSSVGNESTRAISSQSTYVSTNFIIYYDKNSGTTSTDAANVANFLQQIRTTFLNMGFNTPIATAPLPTFFKVYLDPERAPEIDEDTGGYPSAVCYWTSSSSNTASCFITYYNFSHFNINSSSVETNKTKEILIHEYFHAIQNSYNYYSNWFKEACANWAVLAVSESHHIVSGTVWDLLQTDASPTLMENKYGAVVFPMAIHKLCGGYSAIRKIYEALDIFSANLTEAQFRSAVNFGIATTASGETFESVCRKMSVFNIDIDYWYATVFNSIENNFWPSPLAPYLDATSGFVSISRTIGALSSPDYQVAVPSNFNGTVTIEVTFFDAGGSLQIHNKNITNETCSYTLVNNVAINSTASRATYTYTYNPNIATVFVISNSNLPGDVFFNVDITLTP